MDNTKGCDDGPKPDDQTKTASSNDDSDFKVIGEVEEKVVDTEEKSANFILCLTKCLKIIYLVLLFVLVLGTGCLSRVLIHIMIWNLSPSDTNDRNLKLVSIFGYLQPNVDAITRNSSCEDLSCSKGAPLTWTCNDIDNQTCTLAEDVPTTNVSWIWAVMLTISAPYVYTFLTNFSRYCTKRTNEMNYRILFVGIIYDTIQSITLCLLVFFVLPTMAPDMAAVTVYIVIWFPIILNINLSRLLQSIQDKSCLCLSPASAPILFLISIICFVAVVIRSTYWNSKLVAKTVITCFLVSLEWFESVVILICECTKANISEKESDREIECEKGKLKGGEGKTKSEKRKTKDGKGKTEGGEVKTESEKRKTKGGEGKTESEKRKTKDGEGKTKSEKRKTKGGEGETEGGEGKTESEKRKTKSGEGKTESGKRKTICDNSETEGKEREIEYEKAQSEGGEVKTENEKRKTEGGEVKTENEKRITKGRERKIESKHREKVIHKCGHVCEKVKTVFANWIFLYAACRNESENCLLASIKLLTLNLVFLPLIMGFMTDWKKIFEFRTDVVYGCNPATPFVVMIICVCSTFVFFKLAQHACRIQYQCTHFVIPIFINLIITPMVIAVVQQNNLTFIFSDCSVLQPLLKTVLDIPSPDPWLLRLSEITGVLSIICLTSNLCCEEAPIFLQKAFKLFGKAAYCGIYPDASLLLSRKLGEKSTKIKVVPISDGKCKNDQAPKHNNAPTGNDNNSLEPIIVACATMWHEESEEMCKLVTSVLRLGQDSKKKKFGFEAHIFFDDAFTDDEIGGRQLNDYADNLYDAIEKSMRLVYGNKVPKQTMEGTVTEYGWRIPWDIKGRDAKETLKNTHSVANINGKNEEENKETKSNQGEASDTTNNEDDQTQHQDERNGNENTIKDDDQTQHQYCCCFHSKISDNVNDDQINETHNKRNDSAKTIKGDDNTQNPNEQNDGEMTKLFVHFKDKEKIRVKKRWSQVMYMHYLLKQRFNPSPENKRQTQSQTFILALDGDVDFQAEAVDYLLKGMEKNDSVGACCGRIHPIGSGPVIWYQRFEYAVSHWLQKATEYVCGCVLCSPGCFTLFRGSAVVDDNVLAIYSKDPKTSWQRIQFDQGEDRWLCTLLLKQGYRIEYCAAADAKTFAPEGFTEFFKQRRRWIPSTIANIIDILANFRYCAEKNNSISKLYLTYQAFLLCTAVITPASILLLMIGATVIAFDLAPWLAMILVTLPTVVFTISIFAATDKTQLLMASTMSGIYATIMVVVLIGIFKSGIEAGICSETTIFICFVGGIFVVAAMLHPREWMCIVPGLMYFFAVPSASVILMIYAIGNIHITSWGTREGTDDKKQTGKEVDCSFGNVCRCILFPDEASSSGSSPKFRTELKDCTLEEGKTLDLRADITGYPKPNITWYLDNKKIHKSKKIKITFNVSTARLKIKDINVNYSGKYCCVAENEKGKDRLQVQVRVLGKSTKPFGPMFKSDLISRTVQNGTLILETDVTGFPTPKITWDKDGVEIQRDKYFKPRQCGSNVLLKIINAGELRGKITCLAKNESTAVERVYNLGGPFTESDKKRRAPIISTSPNEREYWEDRKKHGLDSKKHKLGVKEQEDISTGLKDLRNKVFFGFFLINIVYFTFVVSLTQTDSTLNQIAFEFPCLYADSVLRFNPIIIAFIGTFGLVLLIQFWGMIYHRMSTFVQIITSIPEETNVVKPANKSQIHSQSSSQQTSRPSSAAKKNGE